MILIVDDLSSDFVICRASCILLWLTFYFSYRDLNNNEISWTIEDVRGAFYGLKNLNRLSLKANHIKSIASEAFTGLDKLRQLHLDNNNITGIQENSFAPLENLRDL